MKPDDRRTDRLKLTVTDVRKEYEAPGEPLVVLDGVSFELAAGDTLAVVGPSGSGKSTLLNIVGSLDKPTSGTVTLGGIEVTALDAAALAAYRSRQVGFVFQDHHLLPQLSALENVVLPSLAAGTTADAVERALELLDRVGLAERMHALPAKLSGGERQRVAIARAMINDPPLLLCDEPTGNLDQLSADTVASLFAELADEKNAMLVVVTHNLKLAHRFARVLELRHGKLEKRGQEPFSPT